jgi:hypothetical protein
MGVNENVDSSVNQEKNYLPIQVVIWWGCTVFGFLGTIYFTEWLNETLGKVFSLTTTENDLTFLQNWNFGFLNHNLEFSFLEKLI